MNRRGFIKALGIGVAGAIAAPMVIPAEAQPPPIELTPEYQDVEPGQMCYFTDQHGQHISVSIDYRVIEGEADDNHRT